MSDGKEKIFENIQKTLHNHWSSFADRLLNSKAEDSQKNEAQPQAKRSQKSLLQKKALVKDRPQTLEDRYQLVTDRGLVQKSFARLQAQLYAACEILELQKGDAPSIFRERGVLASGLPYFYLKPAGKVGFLVEQTEKGWLISQADKIVQKDLFLREEEVVDHVTLRVSQDRPQSPRVNSQRLGSNLLALSLYEQKMMDMLGLGAVVSMLSKSRDKNLV